MSVSDRDLNDAHAILAEVVEACGEKFLPLFDSLDRSFVAFQSFFWAGDLLVSSPTTIFVW